MARPTNRVRSEASRAVIAMRRSMRLTQAGFAAALGVTPVTVARWETAKTPRGESLEQLLNLARSRNYYLAIRVFERELYSEATTEPTDAMFSAFLALYDEGRVFRLIRTWLLEHRFSVEDLDALEIGL